MSKQNIFALTLTELEDICIKLNAKKFNATQIYEWIYKKHVYDFYQMSNISKKLQSELDRQFEFRGLKIVKTQIDPTDKTTKFLFELDDNNHIEAVLMYFNWGNSICISSEIGCAMNCKFCASGRLKLKRRLNPDEMVLQYLQINDWLMKESNQKISNIVIMGIGEPFDNYDNLMKALQILNDHHGIMLGSRHITVSTCGLVDKIVQFGKDQPQVNLAISLHAPIDSIRNELMPINKVYNLDKLMKAIDEYIVITNSRITFEYILLDGINDTDECLKALIRLTRNRLCYVNLISYNSVIETDFNKSKRIDYFLKELNKNGIIATLRLERGSKIDAACGQLRAKYEKENSKID